MTETIPFIDLQAQRERIAEPVERAVLEVVRSGRWILGPEVEACERELAAFAGAKHCLTAASGTDALALALMVEDLRPGDAVICPSFTFAATAEVVAWLGAAPVFADVDPRTFNLDPASAELAVATAKAEGLTPRALIAVDLFGQPADHHELAALAEAHGLWVLDDAAQAFGASYGNRRIGTFGRMTATSFFPAKPLGCYGDGGALFFDDDALVEPLTSLRVHGQGRDKYDNVRIGMNGRMDAIQCAVIRQKLEIFEDEIERRQQVAAVYADGLADVVAVPRVQPDRLSVWAQYTITLPTGVDRGAFRAALQANGVPSAVYYGRPMHRQTAYARYPTAGGDALPVAEELAERVVSLPMHPYLTAAQQERVVDAVRTALT